ncbi:MAG: hypothetical protein CMJ48_04845 [Planctomycetaceae bacterium]|nr:hypothetical protein [Planctomycetaceae bacterium]
MTIPTHSHANTASPATHKWNRILIGSAVLLMLVLLALLLFSSLDRLRPGQLVDDLGTYRSPSGRQKVEISKSPEGNIIVTQLRRSRQSPLLKPYSQVGRTEFEAERDWFLSFDEYDRLWLFIGEWDRDWGRLRRMPSGGTRPYAQRVLLEGFIFTRNGVFRGSSVVSEMGNWEGVPQEFFERLPEKSDAGWAPSAVVPETASPLTPDQHRASAKYWKPR